LCGAIANLNLGQRMVSRYPMPGERSKPEVSEFDKLVSRDGVLMAGRFGPDGRIAEHKSTGLFIEYPPALEMAQWFCAAVASMFNSMAFAVNSISSSTSYQTSWLPVRGWAFTGGDYTIAVHGDRFLLAETDKVKSLDETRRLLRDGEP
jgi:roadblock/LC7 domain-containing protein